MIVVAAGSSSRFDGDKMLTMVGGVALVAMTVVRVSPLVDQCVLVCRADQIDQLKGLALAAVIVPGGPTRTDSEVAGLSALTGDPDLIGIHDGARPNVSPALIERLFEQAALVGGAVPVVPPSAVLIDGDTHASMSDLMAAQTPQVFRGPGLVECYRMASMEGFLGHDTHEVVSRYGSLEVAAVPGEGTNIKVTRLSDLAEIIPR